MLLHLGLTLKIEIEKTVQKEKVKEETERSEGKKKIEYIKLSSYERENIFVLKYP